MDPVALRPDGTLFGFAVLDVYRLTRDEDGDWHKRTIYSFPGGITGTSPTGGPVFDADGNMYGATRSFGIDGPATVFRLSPPAAEGEPWTETKLATLATNFDQPQPWGGLTRGADGTLYGAVRQLGVGGTGYIFAVSP